MIKVSGYMVDKRGIVVCFPVDIFFSPDSSERLSNPPSLLFQVPGIKRSGHDADLVSRLSIRGAIISTSPYAFVACTGITSTYLASDKNQVNTHE